jgi:hypothetical protein
MVDFIDITTTACCHRKFNFKLIFTKMITMVKILSRGIFISMFIKEMYGMESAKYPHCVATSHSTSIVFPTKIMHQLKL